MATKKGCYSCSCFVQRKSCLVIKQVAMMMMVMVIMMGESWKPIGGALETHVISGLPGQPAVNFKQYGGFVNVDLNANADADADADAEAEADVDRAAQPRGRHLFYYFVQAAFSSSSSSSPLSNMPLTLWLNGGPGCSSVGGGAFTELGPFRPNNKGDGLLLNLYSWNRVSNILFLESPSGVGFSYSNTDGEDSSDDSTTASQNLAFLLAWLRDFPEYQASKLFLAGESYAGHYIPQLADLILKYNAKATNGFTLNLQGIIIGNPLLNFGLDTNATYSFLWSHGVISDQTYEGIKNLCDFSYGYPSRNQDSTENDDVHDKNGGKLSATIELGCSRFIEKSKQETGNIDPFDVTLDTCKPAMMKQQLKLQNLVSAAVSKSVDVCTDDEVGIYLNRPAVQSALHANTSGLPYRWEACSNLDYPFQDQLQDMLPLLSDLLQKGLRIWIYSGDQDSVVPLTGTRTQVDSLASKLGLSTTIPYSAWYAHGQVGGWTTTFGNLTYATVRGAAHMVPYAQPQRALVLFQAFLNGKRLPLR